MEFVKPDKWHLRFTLCLLTCTEFHLLPVVKSFENSVTGGNTEILGWCAEFECVPTTALYLGSAISINDELYRGFRKGNPAMQINEFPVGKSVATTMVIFLSICCCKNKRGFSGLSLAIQLLILSYCSLWLRGYKCVSFRCENLV